MKEYDMSQILAVLNEAHDKLMNLSVPKKPKVKKREKALRELRRRINSGSFLCGIHPADSGIIQQVLTAVTHEIDQILEKDEQSQCNHLRKEIKPLGVLQKAPYK
tara:strand:+ start:194 stop:508 length:315 start_codon:yes stop_codon:yes gene_type:complete